MQHAQIVVIGAGAAGTLAATFAARTLHAHGKPGRVLVLETRRQPGAKIRVSGGGRCNILPSVSCLADFESRGSSNALRNILLSWPLEEVTHFFKQDLGLPLQIEPSGKVFPVSNESRDVVQALLHGLEEAGVTLQTSTEVRSIACLKNDGKAQFALKLADDSELICERVIVATGGLSMPRTGSDGHGLLMLKKMGHAIEVTAPSLVPLLGEEPWAAQLSGLSVECGLKAVQRGKIVGQHKGALLFTHRGLSGPVVLDISRLYTLAKAQGVGPEDKVYLTATWGRAATASCASTFWRAKLAAAQSTTLGQLLRSELPRRLVEALVKQAGLWALQTQAVSSLSREQKAQLLTVLIDMPLAVNGSEGYRTAECTTGGVALGEVAWRTLQSRRTPGIYLCGEVLDVTGRLGGFNFLWAWTSGRKAGQAAAMGLIEQHCS